MAGLLRCRRPASCRLSLVLASTCVNALTYAPPAAAESVPGVEAGAVLRVVVALVVVVVVILALAWTVRRFAGPRAALSGQMRILGTLPLGQRERAVLVQVGETQLLLGVAPGRVQTLLTLDTPITESNSVDGAQGVSFAARLRSAVQQSGQK